MLPICGWRGKSGRDKSKQITIWNYAGSTVLTETPRKLVVFIAP